MQQILIAGDTLDFDVSVPDYPATAGYTLKYRLVPRAAGSAITITATANGAAYAVEVAPATTAGWASGEYSWSSWVEISGARYTVDSGQITIKPDPATLTAGTDTRSAARQIYESLVTQYQTHVTNGQAFVGEYEIGGRRMKFDNKADWIKTISYWKSQVAAEDRAANIAAGREPGNRLLVRF